MIEVFFDLETKSLFSEVNSRDPKDLGVSIISIYQREIDQNRQEISGSMQSFWKTDFNKMWRIFQEADRVIGFNTLSFDVPALQPYAYFDLNTLRHFDILQKVKESLGRRLSLDLLAQSTLNTGKTDSGIKAVEYWRSQSKKDLAKLKKYCEQDVIITRDLYDFGMKNKYLKYIDKWNHPRKVSIDFSYPKKNKDDGKQIGLF